MKLLLCLALAATMPALAEEPVDPADRGPDPDLTLGVRGVAEHVESLREIKVFVPPDAVRVPADFRRVAAVARVAGSIAPDRLEARGRAWEDIGLASAASPASLYRVLAEDVAGLAFDAIEGRLLVDPDRLTETDFRIPEDGGESEAVSLLMATGLRPDEPVIAHVLVHAIQQANEDHRRLPETTDALLAQMAWAEGEANLVAARFLFQAMAMDVDVLPSGLDISKVQAGALVSPMLTLVHGAEHEILDWVYLDGFDQAMDRFRAGGWPELIRAMEARTTTRDVMHLDRAPSQIGPIAEPSPGLPSGFRLADRDTIGERAIAALVSHRSGKVNLGLISGDGWAGDALFRWEADDDDRGVTVWITRWVSDDEARDFEYGYIRALEGWTGVTVPEPEESGERRVVARERVIIVMRQGREVRVRVGPGDLVPSAANSPAGSDE